jgi:uncharacterized repeat protein (TIGR03803 family)
VLIRKSHLLVTLLIALGLIAPGFSQQADVTTIHTFTGAPNDGNHPVGGLMQASDGNFYGATRTGGANDFGCVFKIDGQTFAFSILYSFANNKVDGKFPSGGLVESPDHELYGLTSSGGNGDFGTAYQIDLSGNEVFLYSFGDNPGDGRNPQGTLAMSTEGKFYGTDLNLGSDISSQGQLFLYRNQQPISPFHDFIGSPDGAHPAGGVFAGAGFDGAVILYGVTTVGGSSNNGIVFRSGSGFGVTVAHSFNGTSDGASAQGSIIADSLHNLYGVTSAAGGLNSGGTVYKMTQSGVFTVLHTFADVDGKNPTSGLMFGPGGYLYGVNTLGPYLVSTTGAFASFNIGKDYRAPMAPLFTAVDGQIYGEADNDLNGVYRLTVSPTVVSATPATASVVGGQSAQVGFSLTLPASTGGTTVSVASDSSAASVPVSVVVPAGVTNGSVVINTVPVTQDTVAHITMSLNGSTTAETLTIHTATVTGAIFRPASAIGGTVITATVTLSSPAASTGESVNFTCASGLVVVPVSLQIPGGQTTASFNFLTKGVTASTLATVKFSRWNTSQNASVTLLPAAITLLSPLASTISGGQQDTVSVGVDGLTASPIGLQSSDTTSLTVPASVTMPNGQIHTTFRATSLKVSVDKSVTITATYHGSTKVCTIKVLAAKLSVFNLGPTPVVGGRPLQGLVSIAGAAATGGAVVHLASSSTAVTVSATVTIAAGASYKYFSATANPVDVTTNVTVTASLNGISKTASIMVNPPVVFEMSLASVSFKGGTGTTGRVYLNEPAGSQGVVVHLFLSNTAVASVAPTVTIPAGQTSAQFSIGSSATQSSATVTITASSASGGLVSRTFTVTP